jgi:hypothetical protein
VSERAAALVRLVYYPDYLGTDDSYIHAAIIENLRAGEGWGINPGQPVNLSTSPLFTLLMLGLSHVVSDVMVAGSRLATAAVMFGVFGTFVIATRMSGNAAIGFVAAALAATNLHVWRWTGTFIEAPLAFGGVILILLAFVRLYLDRIPWPLTGRFFALGVAIGGLALLRFETALLGPAFFIHHLINDRRFLVQRYAAATLGGSLPLALWAAYAWGLFGGVVPTTLEAKTSDGIILFNTTLLWQYAGVLGPGFFAGGIVVIAALALLWVRGRAGRTEIAMHRSVLFVVFICAGLAFYYVKMPSLQSPARYLLPFMAVLPLAASPFIAEAWTIARRHVRAIAAGALALQLALAIFVTHTRVAPVLTGMQSDYVDTMREVARQLDARCAPGDVVLIYFDIGVVSREHDHRCRIVDGGALASPELQGLPLDAMIATTRPRFVVESLGTPAHSDVAEAAPDAREVWARSFASHSVGAPKRVYRARLFELNRSGTFAARQG